MRNPSNETPSVDNSLPSSPPASREGSGEGVSQGDGQVNGPSSDPSRKREGNEAVRRCILSGEHAAREHLVRLALSPDGEILPDVRAKAPGRGAWIGVTRAELETAQAKGRLKGMLARAFKTSEIRIPGDLGELVETQLRRNLLDRLGLESRSGVVVTGGEKLDKAARSGKLHLLLHAADAGEDGSRKLAQAWRVGSDQEGSDLKGLALPIPRTILSLALGRENVVHAGLIDARAARRVSEALDRWLHFIGPEHSP